MDMSSMCCTTKIMNELTVNHTKALRVSRKKKTEKERKSEQEGNAMMIKKK